MATAHMQHAYSQCQWLAEHAAERDVHLVLHAGDFVQLGSVEAEWAAAKGALDQLLGHVPHVVSAGNHDDSHSLIQLSRYFVEAKTTEAVRARFPEFQSSYLRSGAE